MEKNNYYNDDSIQSISPREFTRARPGVYCGSTEYSTQLLREIFANALDEHVIGHGEKIIVNWNTNDNIYSILDEAQGFPINIKREDGETVLQAAFDVLNTSGKYDETGVYGGSVLGLNGIGGKLVNFLSKYTKVKSSNGSGKEEELYFEDGIFISRKINKVAKTQHGTYVEWQPDPQFFNNKEINEKDITELFEEISALCPTLIIEFNKDENQTIFHSKNGIQDLVDKKVKNNEVIKRFNCKLSEGDSLFDICLTYTNGFSEDITSYVNFGKTDGGVHITTLRSNLTRTINKYATENKLFKKNEENLTGQELSEGLVIVFNLKANGVSYDSQSKTRVVGIDRELINKAINENFYQWLSDNAKDAKTIIDRALIARKAREAAKKARDNVRKPKEKGLKAKMQLSDKFIDCSSKDPTERRLVILEGVSAGSAAVEARDPRTDSIYLLRGKILSPIKSDITKILANQELSDLINIIGGGYGENFNINNINFDKIIIFSDSDAE